MSGRRPERAVEQGLASLVSNLLLVGLEYGVAIGSEDVDGMARAVITGQRLLASGRTALLDAGLDALHEKLERLFLDQEQLLRAVRREQHSGRGGR